jgi:hypothetical protein
MFCRALLCFLVCISGLCSAETVAVQPVRYPAGSFTGDFRFSYPIRVLQLALDKTAQEYGPAQAIYASVPMNTGRIASELELGQLLDVATFPASRDLDKRFDAVPFDIRKGILGIRLFLIDRKRQPQFNRVRSAEDLQKMSAGQGFDWLDAKILKNNGYTVITSSSYEALFGMLMARRFDYYPRGLYEPFTEQKAYQVEFPDLSVENSLALYYPYPDYFYVRKGNTVLAARLQKGLELALEDGSFDALFNAEFGATIKQARLDKRTFFVLTNQEVSEIRHECDPKYWLINSIRPDVCARK